MIENEKMIDIEKKIADNQKKLDNTKERLKTLQLKHDKLLLEKDKILLDEYMPIIHSINMTPKELREFFSTENKMNEVQNEQY